MGKISSKGADEYERVAVQYVLLPCRSRLRPVMNPVHACHRPVVQLQA